MDIFIEEMVSKTKTAKDRLLNVGIIALAAVLFFVMVGILIPMFAAFSSIIFLLAAGVVYGAYYLINMSNVEFEYSLVNTEIDIDKIINKTKRKKITCAPIRGLEAFGTKQNPDFDGYLSNPSVTKVYACRDKSADDVIFMVYNQSDKKMMLLFSPSEKIVEQIKKRNPQKQFI